MPKQMTKMWEVLIEAKKLLVTELSRDAKISSNQYSWQYICHCIEDTGAPRDLVIETRRHVRDLINPHYSFETWMCESIGRDEVRQDIEKNNQKKLQQARHDFVDWMITDLKSRNL